MPKARCRGRNCDSLIGNLEWWTSMVSLIIYEKSMMGVRFTVGVTEPLLVYYADRQTVNWLINIRWWKRSKSLSTLSQLLRAIWRVVKRWRIECWQGGEGGENCLELYLTKKSWTKSERQGLQKGTDASNVFFGFETVALTKWQERKEVKMELAELKMFIFGSGKDGWDGWEWPHQHRDSTDWTSES